MSVETSLQTALDNYAGLIALVGTRNYALRIPQNPTYPNTVYHIVSKPPINTLQGTDTKEYAMVQIDVRDTTYSGTKAVVTQVKAAVATLKSTVQAEEDIPYEDVIETYRIMLRFLIWA